MKPDPLDEENLGDVEEITQINGEVLTRGESSSVVAVPFAQELIGCFFDRLATTEIASFSLEEGRPVLENEFLVAGAKIKALSENRKVTDNSGETLEGQNILGHLLMELRELLRTDSNEAL